MSDGRSFVGVRYVTRFSCIGAACEDPCCTEWDVPVDQVHLDALRQAMSGSPEEEAEFAAALVPFLDESRRAVSLMVQRPDGRCVMFGADRLCAIQRRYGEAPLPNGCAIYPRSVGQVGEQVELSASLSCPEAARLCLLSEDGTALVPIDPSLIVRGEVHRHIGPPRSLAEAAFQDIRGLCRELFATPDFPLDSRLYFVATFIDRASPLLQPDAGPREGMQLQSLMQMMRQRALLEKLHAQLGAIEIPEPFAATVVSQLLSAAGRRGTSAFHRMLDTVFGSYGAVGGASRDDAGAWVLDAVGLAGAYDGRRQAMPVVLERRIEHIVTAFCQNHVFRDWYLRAPSLRSYGMGLLVRVATIRFLLRSHPALAAGLEALDEAAVQVVYTLSRALDHDAALLQAVLESLSEQGMETLPHAVCLLKF